MYDFRETDEVMGFVFFLGRRGEINTQTPIPKNHDYAFLPLSNKYTKESKTQSRKCALRKSQFPSHHEPAQQVNIDYISRVPRAIILIPLSAARYKFMAPHLHGDIRESKEENFSAEARQKGPSCYEDLIHMPSSGVLRNDSKCPAWRSVILGLKILPNPERSKSSTNLRLTVGKCPVPWHCRCACKCLPQMQSDGFTEVSEV